jgi:hypothetical protein
VQEASRAGRGRLPDELENSAEWMVSMCAVTLHCMRFLEGRQKGTVWILKLQKAEIKWRVTLSEDFRGLVEEVGICWNYANQR